MTNVFKPTALKGKRLPEVEYTPLLYTAGGTTHRLALHKDLMPGSAEELKDWVVSEPTTGMRVRTVTSKYKGLTVASRGLGPRDARDAAVATLDALVLRVGEAHFNEVMKKALQHQPGQHNAAHAKKISPNL